MAKTSYPVNHPSAVKHWSAEVFKEALKRTFALKFMGQGSDALCQIRNEMKQEGDRIRVHLRMQLAGAGVSGDGTLEGNEEAITIYTDDVFIDQLRHAARSAGRMSEQRVPFSVRDELKDGLADWWADRIDTSFFNQLGGNTTEADIRNTGMQVAIAPSTNHAIVQGASSTSASLSDSAGHYFTLQSIDKAVELAQTLGKAGTGDGTDVPLRPIRMGGREYYVCFIHPYQYYDLRRSATQGDMSWADIQRAAVEGGAVQDSPIWTGAAGVYNGTIIHVSPRVPSGLANTRRAIFCGAQAASIAFGKGSGPGTFEWVEEMFDYNNQFGVAAGAIWGLKKMQFNSRDFGTITLTSYAVRHDN